MKTSIYMVCGVLRTTFLCIALFFVYFVNASNCVTPKEAIRVLYFAPYNADGTFWDMQKRFAINVAKSIDIDLEVIQIVYPNNNRFSYLDLVKTRLERANKTKKVNLILGVFYLNGEEAFLNFIEEYRTPFISVNTSLNQSILKKIKKPREKYKYWIAHLSPNDKQAGRKLATDLVNRNRRGTTMLGIAGESQSTVSFNRVKGLMAAQDSTKFELFPLIHTDWTTSQARDASKSVLSRFNDINTVWTAGSSTALGVLEYLRTTPETKSKVKVGTFDWTTDILNLIINDQIYVSYGGHYKEAGWALLLAKDYLSGFDFKPKHGTFLQTRLLPATKQNAPEILKQINQDWEGTNFLSLTKCHNSKLIEYPFL